MLMKELRIHSALRHPGIVRLFAVIEDGKEDNAYASNAPTSPGFVYMLMEYASGGELFDKIGMLEFSSACHRLPVAAAAAADLLASPSAGSRTMRASNPLLLSTAHISCGKLDSLLSA